MAVPYGPGAWLSYARSKDNPLFIENINKFLKSNAGNIAYEAYYNCQDNSTYRVYPEGVNPQSSNAYQRLWSR